MRPAEWALGECAQPEGLRFTKARVAKLAAPLAPPMTGPVPSRAPAIVHQHYNWTMDARQPCSNSLCIF